MTPVEERIDHEEARRIAEQITDAVYASTFTEELCLARAYLALLVENAELHKAIAGMTNNA